LLKREQRGTWAFYSVNEETLRRLSDVVGRREIAS
jgi:hypothetical protein